MLILLVWTRSTSSVFGSVYCGIFSPLYARPWLFAPRDRSNECVNSNSPIRWSVLQENLPLLFQPRGGKNTDIFSAFRCNSSLIDGVLFRMKLNRYVSSCYVENVVMFVGYCCCNSFFFLFCEWDAL